MKYLYFFIFITLILFGQNAFALNIHREHSETYIKELNNKNLQDDDMDEDIMENIPLIPVRNQSSGGVNIPYFTPNATFMLPDK